MVTRCSLVAVWVCDVEIYTKKNEKEKRAMVFTRASGIRCKSSTCRAP